MRWIDMESWPRQDQYAKFVNFYQPLFGLVANVDITGYHAAVKKRGVPITPAIVYVLARAANDVPEFRYRLRPEGVVEHEVVHPSFTALVDDETFSFCTVEYTADFDLFVVRAAEQIERVKAEPTLHDAPGEDNLLFMSAMPWVSFTGLMHPMPTQSPDSVPRIAWGKFFREGDSLKMPLGVQAHHGLMDGLHVGRYYAAVQEYLDRPAAVMGEGG